jgi:hypothetical protein
MLNSSNLQFVYKAIIEIAAKKDDTKSASSLSRTSNFYPDLEKVIKKSISDGKIDSKALEENLERFYISKFNSGNHTYFFNLRKTLKTKEGSLYLKRILG